MTYELLLTLIVFLPAAGALVLMLPTFSNRRPDAIRLFSLAVTIAVFAITAWMAIDRPAAEVDSARFQVSEAAMQDTFSLDWIKSFNIYYYMGVDGISFTLVVLTSFVSLLAMAASWNITKHVKAYCILFLLLETGMLGVFLALDFFLFYVFWEVMLLPMYFLIGVWGGPRREYAAIKFFLYTLVGSVLMLIAILMLYFNSDLQLLSPEQLAKAHVPESVIRPGRRRRPNRCIRSIFWRWPRLGSSISLLSISHCGSANRSSGGPLSCCSSALPSRCRPCRCIPGCQMPTSRRRRRSR